MLGALRFLTNTALALLMACVVTAVSAAIAAAITLCLQPELGFAVEIGTSWLTVSVNGFSGAFYANFVIVLVAMRITAKSPPAPRPEIGVAGT